MIINSVGIKPLVTGIDKNQKSNLNEQRVKTEETQSNKVQEIRQAIKNGSYKIDLQQTSEKMALNLLNL